jgi:hypothetical protein
VNHEAIQPHGRCGEVTLTSIIIGLLSTVALSGCVATTAKRMDRIEPEPAPAFFVSSISKQLALSGDQLSFKVYVPLDGAMVPLTRKTPRGQSASASGVIRFRVDGRGDVRDVVTLEMDDADVSSELVRRVKMWKFLTNWGTAPERLLTLEIPVLLKVEN